MSDKTYNFFKALGLVILVIGLGFLAGEIVGSFLYGFK